MWHRALSVETAAGRGQSHHDIVAVENIGTPGPTESLKRYQILQGNEWTELV